jgi:hypothetical protein
VCSLSVQSTLAQGESKLLSRFLTHTERVIRETAVTPLGETESILATPGEGDAMTLTQGKRFLAEPLVQRLDVFLRAQFPLEPGPLGAPDAPLRGCIAVSLSGGVDSMVLAQVS